MATEFLRQKVEHIDNSNDSLQIEVTDFSLSQQGKEAVKDELHLQKDIVLSLIEILCKVYCLPETIRMACFCLSRYRWYVVF